MSAKYALIALAGMTAMTPVVAHERIARLDSAVTQVQPQVEPDLITRGKTGLAQYLKAYGTGDVDALGRILTSDATFEYAAEAPGVYRTIDAGLLIQGSHSYAKARGAAQAVSNLEVYATPKENTVFAHYDLGAGTPTHERHIVLVEMRGDRIAKIRDFVSVG